MVMWQKVNRLDTFELERARIQLLNAVQLVSASARCFSKSKTKLPKDWLSWNDKNLLIESSVFGTKEKVKVTLDINQFVLSIQGNRDHVEHLVLSGITYPMAFGWMKIKLDSFQLDGDLFNDDTEYTIEHVLDSDDELKVTSQHIFESLVIYYLNANCALHQLIKDLNIQGEIRINPSSLNLELSSLNDNVTFGFSPGDRSYPEPYFFIKLQLNDENLIPRLSKSTGIWNNKNWNGLVFLSSEFITLDPDQEKSNVLNFFKNNHEILIDK